LTVCFSVVSTVVCISRPGYRTNLGSRLEPAARRHR